MIIKRKVQVIDTTSFTVYGKIPRTLFKTWCNDLKKEDLQFAHDCSPEQQKEISRYIGLSVISGWYAPNEETIFVTVKGKDDALGKKNTGF